jgi:hypothetical protein
MILLLCVQIGIMPINNYQLWDYNEHPTYENQFEDYLSFDFEFEAYDIFFIGGKINTIFFQKNIKNYVPVEMEFLFKTGVRWRGFEIGFNHFCQHPVTTFNSHKRINVTGEGGYEKLYLQYAGEIEVW